MIDLHATEQDAQAAMQRKGHEKRRRGYPLLIQLNHTLKEGYPPDVTRLGGGVRMKDVRNTLFCVTGIRLTRDSWPDDRRDLKCWKARPQRPRLQMSEALML